MKLIMVSAGFEQGGNTLLRHLDGHPNLLVYPFESMLGTPNSTNLLTPAVPFRYAWPEFSNEDSYLSAYQKFYDEEMKTYLRSRDRSKFKDCGMDIDEKDRIKSFVGLMDTKFRTRANFVKTYFQSTFDSWKNLNKSGNETHYVGYIPGVLMDTDKIISDFPDAKIIHIIRNPWSGYADTIKRPYPWTLEKYCQIWNIIQMTALTYKQKYPNNFDTVYFENLCGDPEGTMKDVSNFLEIPYDNALTYPSFNGKKLDSIYPWGTIKQATVEENNKTADELSEYQKKKIMIECALMAQKLGYI
jgi:hypothetical protein